MNQPRKANGQFACKPKMPQWIAMWIAALRSGLYEQGTKYLNCDGKYCCLGVLCEIVPGVKKKEDKAHPGLYRYGESGRTGCLPNEINNQLKFRSSYGDVSSLYLKDKSELAAANDSGATFDEIADFIEKNWPALLKE